MRAHAIARTMLLFAIPVLLVTRLTAAIDGVSGAVASLIDVLILCAAVYILADRLALAMIAARPYHASLNFDAQPMLADLAAKARVPVPALYVLDDPSMTVCAIGRGQMHAAVVVTTGLLAELDDEEVRATLAVAVARIARCDVLPATVGMIIASAILLPTTVFRFTLPRTRNGERWLDAPIGLLLLLLILLPPAALFLHTANPHRSQYAADQDAAYLCGNPLALAGVLRLAALEARLQPPRVPLPLAPLCIVHPFAAVKLLDLLDTHPPAAERASRLEALAEISPNAAGV